MATGALVEPIATLWRQGAGADPELLAEVAARLSKAGATPGPPERAELLVVLVDEPEALGEVDAVLRARRANAALCPCPPTTLHEPYGPAAPLRRSCR
mgnify:CR=1 FL=1